MVGSNVSFCVDGVQVHLFVRSRRWFEGSENYWVSRGWLEPNVFEISFQIRRLRYFWDFDFGLKVEDD
ncbi:hypothetical protein U1Q18_003330 [Sarracenia purpurea var. burkii]